MPSAVGIYFASLLVLYLLYSLPMSYIKVGEWARARDGGCGCQGGLWRGPQGGRPAHAALQQHQGLRCAKTRAAYVHTG